MKYMENDNATVRMLLLTADPSLVATFSNLSSELHIEAQSSEDSKRVSDDLSRGKYEGIVLDFDTVANVRPVLARVRKSRTNKNAIVLAVATSTRHIEEALQDQAHFVLRRPLDLGSIRQTLHAAYGLMEKERRRYFRVGAQLPVRITLSAPRKTLLCSTTNVSSNGMGITTPVPLKLAEKVAIALVLPDGFVIGGSGVVIWDDKHGKSGLHFTCSTREVQTKLDLWLDGEFSAQKGLRREI